MTDKPLTNVRGSAHGELARWRPHFEAALARGGRSADEARAIVDDAASRLDGVLAHGSDPGMTAPQMRAFSVGGALYVALYLALEARGVDAKSAWEVCEHATQARFAAMKGLERSLASDGMFGWPMKALSRWLAKRSHEAPVGGWVFSFVEGEAGAFDYGVDYERCAIREMAVASGAAAFAPYICLSDVVGSNELGWGLVRTETIAQGGKRCDFRFRRGGATDVKVRLPVVSE